MERLFQLLTQARASTVRHHNRVTRSELGISVLELTALWVTREPTPASAVAEALQIDPGAATRLVDQLVKKGLAQRTVDPTDRRRRLVQRTEAGSALARRGTSLVAAANARLREGFTEDELTLVARFLRHLIESVGDPMSNAITQLRDRVGGGPLGLWLISTAICFKAPYFRSISPTFTVLEPGHVAARMPKRRAVTNHLGTVHAIAMCNLAELVGGTCLEMTLPGHLRWIPVGMEVSYDKLAKTDLVATARVDVDTLVPGDHVIPIAVTDTAGQQVFTARIKMRVSERKKRSQAA